MSGPICEVKIPMDCNNIGTAHGENVHNTDLLDIELDLRVLSKELTKPFFDRRFTGECTAGPDLPPG